MVRRRHGLGCAVGAAPCVAGETQPGRLIDVVGKVREARIAGDKAAWLVYARQALAFAPEHQDLLFSTARAEAANGFVDEAFVHFEEAVRRGGGFDLAAATELKPLESDPRYKAIAARNARNSTPIARAELFVAFDATVVAPEGITYDVAGRRFLVGSARGEIWQAGMDRSVALFVRDGSLREVLGMKVDAARNLVWCATGVYPDGTDQAAAKPGFGTTGIRAFDLTTRALKAKADLDERPVEHGFNDLAVARNGDVYATDSSAQSIYRIKSGTDTIERVYAADDLTYVNGLALSADDATLYVAHVEGISAIDLKRSTHRRLAIGPEMTVGSIDGLMMKDGVLIGVQNSANLARIVRLQLSADGHRVAKLDVLASRGPLDLVASTGVIVDDAVYVVASVFGPPGEGPPPRILKISLMPS